MPTAFRLVVSLAAVAAVLGAAALVLFLAPGELAYVERERERGDRLDQRNQALQRLGLDKGHVVREVIARRLTLPEAAAAFRRLDADIRHEAGPGAGPGLEDFSDDAVCELVLDWVRIELRDDPRCDAVLGELEAEFAARFGHAPQRRLDPQPVGPAVHTAQ
jgi:hypothetical protein